jgi:hypothetical protein
LHRNLHVDRKSKTMVSRVFARDRRVDEDHHSVAGEPDQGGFMAGRDGSNGFIIFAQHGHNGIGLGVRGKSSEAAQVAEDRDDLTPLSIQQPLIGVFDQFRYLWREELLQAIDALRLLLGH